MGVDVVKKKEKKINKSCKKMGCIGERVGVSFFFSLTHLTNSVYKMRSTLKFFPIYPHDQGRNFDSHTQFTPGLEQGSLGFTHD